MKITDNKVVVLHYAVSDSEDTLIDSSYDHEPLSVIQGSHYPVSYTHLTLPTNREV